MDILSQPVLPADHRIHYAAGSCQFGDLWLPPGPPAARVPLVVFFHGGWWKSRYDLGYAGYLCSAFTKEGIAVWSVEYRRVGDTGGGWPTTFQDAAAGVDYAAVLARSYPLDLSRVITMGHSAGGHLAFWVAGRHHIAPNSEIYVPRPQVSLRGAVALAGAVDLRLTVDLAGYFTYTHDREEVRHLMGGLPPEFADRYKAGNPGDLLPLNVPQVLLQGSADDQIPPDLPNLWAAMARRSGDKVTVEMIPSADHFDLVNPQSHAWGTVRDAVRKLVFA
jgi:acetyl esterase/lipase